MSSLLAKTVSPVWILGAGALGRFIAREIKQKEIYSLRDRREILPDGVEVKPVSELKLDQASGTLIFCGKAYQFTETLELLHGRSELRLIILSNGMGLYSEAVSKWKFGEVHRGVVNTGLQIDSDNQLQVMGRPEFVFSSESLRAEELEWRKGITNTVINGIATVYRCKNGKLISNPLLKNSVDVLLRELKSVAFVVGCDFSAQDDALVWDVINNTAKNTNSLLQDVNSKRSQFEWSAYGGVIQRTARKFGLLTPHLDEVVFKLNAIGVITR